MRLFRHPKVKSLTLGPLIGDQALDLETLPGAKFFESDTERYVYGKADVIAAAIRRIGAIFDPPFPALPAAVDLSRYENLFGFQRRGVAEILGIIQQTGGAILADDMGLGKTRQAVVVASELGGRALVICPASVRMSWRAELARLGVPVQDTAILGPPSKASEKKGGWSRVATAKWVVTSYELFRRAIEEGFATQAPRTLIIDEAHAIKGRKNLRSKELEQLGRQVTYRLGLTGTPIWNRPRDFYQLLHIVVGATFGTAFAFDMAYCAGHINEHGGMDNRGVSNSDELRLRLKYYMVRRERKEVALELPKLRREIRWVDLDKTAGKMSTAFHLKSASITDALKATLKAKMETCVELAQEAGKFLMFTWLKEHAHELYSMLTKAGVACHCITGELSHTKRQELIDDARKNGMGIVATVDSCGTGVDGLQKVASIGIFHAIDYVPQKMLQAEARLNRIGQEEPVTWYYVCMKETVDEVVVKMVTDKLDGWRAVMGDGEATELHSDFAQAETGDEDVLRQLYSEMKDE